MIDTYPDFPGFNATDTSREAAEALSEHLGRLQSLTQATIKDAGLTGLTAHETAAKVGIDRMAIQPRISELRKKGLIRDSGQRRRNASGKNAIVWIAVEVPPNG